MVCSIGSIGWSIGLIGPSAFVRSPPPHFTAPSFLVRLALCAKRCRLVSGYSEVLARHILHFEDFAPLLVAGVVTGVNGNPKLRVASGGA